MAEKLLTRMLNTVSENTMMENIAIVMPVRKRFASG